MATFGGAVNASADLVDRFGKAVSDLAPALVKATRGLTDPANGMVNGLTALTGKLVGLVPGLGGVGKALGSLGTAATAAVSGVIELGKALSHMVGLANPVIASQFALALNDLMAVIGQALIPVFKLLTELVRAWADTVITYASDMGATVGQILRPFVDVIKVGFDLLGRVGQQFAKLLDAVGPAVQSIGAVVLQVVEAFAPLVNLVVELLGGALGAALKVLGAAVEAIAPVLIALAKVVGQVVSWIVGGIRELLGWLGIDLEDRAGTKPGASVGAATRQASTTDVESVIRKARENAFTLGTASSDPTRKSAGHLESLDKKADRIIELFREMPEKIARAILGDGIVDAVEGAVDTLVEAKDAVLDAGRSALTFVGLREEDKPGGAFDDILRRADEFRARVARDGGGGVVRPE